MKDLILWLFSYVFEVFLMLDRIGVYGIILSNVGIGVPT